MLLLRIALYVLCLAVAAGVLVNTRAAAQPAPGAAATTVAPPAAPGAPATDLKWFDFFVLKGGWITVGLIALSIVALALAVEHCISIRRASIVPSDAAERIKTLLDERQYADAVKFASEEPSMLGHVLTAGLVEAANGYASMERAVQESLEERSARLFRKIEYLNVIGNVSPMIGLFGTVYGMILLFAEIHAQDAFPPARDVADKIAIALITTFWGLLVAIPSLSAFAIFRNRIDVLTAECALAVERTLAVFRPSGAAAAGVSRGM
jgi:biopolymer transport protein ExbB